MKSGLYHDNRGHYVVNVDGLGETMLCPNHKETHRFKQVQFTKRRGNYVLPHLENLFVSEKTGEIQIVLSGSIESAVYPGLRFVGTVSEDASIKSERLNQYLDRALRILKRMKPARPKA